MTGPVIQNAGAVGVDVYPDGRQFATRLRAIVLPAAASVGQEVGGAVGAPVAEKVSASVRDGVRHSGRTATPAATAAGRDIGNAVARALQEKLREAARTLPDFKIDADSTPLQRKLAEIKRQMAELSGAVDIDPNEAAVRLQALRNQLSQVSREIEKLRAQGAEGVEVDIDALKAMAAVTALKREVDGLRREADRPIEIPVRASDSFESELRRRMRAAVEALPDIELHADASDAEREITAIRAELEGLRDAKIGVDVDAAGALAHMAALEARLKALGHEGVDVQIRVDAARALAEVVAFRTAAEAAGSSGQGAFASIGSAAAAAAGDIGLLPIAIIAAAPIIAVAAGVIAGALLAILPIIAIVVGAISGAVLGFLGIGEAVSALRAKQQDAAKEAQDHAEKLQAVQQASQGLANAQQALGDAVRNAADAHRAAIQGIANAERQLADSQRNGLQAQKDLTTARREAKRAIEDLDQSVKHNALDQADAADQLKQAEANLAAIRAGLPANQAGGPSNVVTGGVAPPGVHPTVVDPRAVTQAQRAVEEAKLRVQDLQIQGGRLTDDQKRAHQQGVEGSDQVVAAQERVRQSVVAISDAERGLAEARHRYDEEAITSAESVARARQGVADAAEALTRAQRQAAQLSPAVQKAADALAALSPAGRDFAQFVVSELLPLFDQLKHAAEGGLLPGLEDGLKALLPYKDQIAQVVGTFASAIGGFFDALAKGMATPYWSDFFTQIANASGPMFRDFATILLEISHAFGELIKAFLPVSGKFVDALAKMATGFADMVTNWVNSGDFQKFIDYLIVNGPLLLDVFIHLGIIVVKLAIALAPVGHLMLEAADAIGGFLASLDPDTLLLIVGVIGTLIAIVAGLAGAPVIAIGAVVVAVMALFGLVAEYLPQIGEFFTGLYTDYIQPAFGAIAAVALWLWRNVIEPAWGGIELAIEIAWAAIEVIFGLIQIGIKILAAPFIWLWNEIISPIWDWIVRKITDAWEKYIKPIWDVFSAYLRDEVAPKISQAIDAIGKMWDGLKALFKAPIEFVVVTVLNNGLLAGYNEVAKFFKVTPDDVKIPWPPAGWAAGGPVRGPGGPTDDLVPALLSDGEHVWTAREVSAAGGHEGVERLRRAVLGERYAEGGPVGAGPRAGGVVDDIAGIFTDPLGTLGKAALDLLPKIPAAGKLTEVVANMGRRAVDAVVDYVKNLFAEDLPSADFRAGVGQDSIDAIIGLAHRSGVPFTVSSTYRPGDPGYHGKHNAVDMFDSEANMVRLAQFFYRFYPYELELIHSGGGGYFVKDGRKVDAAYYGPSTVGQHYNHVHAAMTRTGVGAAIAALTGVGPAVGGARDARGYARSQFGRYGWGPDQFDPLNRLWNQESGWNPNAVNPSSGAYGIPQALPAVWGHPYNLGDFIAQVNWGLDYIRNRYGTPGAAWRHEQGFNWYDQGGLLMPGVTYAVNATGRPERVLTEQQWQLMADGRAGDTFHYEIKPLRADFSMVDLQALQARQEALARVGRPR